MSKKIVIITGASSGIGREFANQLDRLLKYPYEFWLIGRSSKKLEHAARSLTHSVKIIPMDITREENQDRLISYIEKRKVSVKVLVNSAGFGIMGPVVSQSPEALRDMILLNCTALTLMTRKLLPYMDQNSNLIQLASCAAFLPQEDFAVYAASKSYVLSFSRALGAELKDKGICVTAVCPGPVDTPFFDIAEVNGHTLSIKKYTMVSPKQVVQKACRDAFLGRSISVCSCPIKLVHVASKLLPHGVLLAVMKQMKKRGL